MLPASNAGVGMNVGFPDPCLTPTPAGPVPVPYPNLAMNATSLNFVPNVFVTAVPANNMATKTVMSSGDEGGVAHPLFKGPGGYTMGMPNVLVAGMPGVTVGCPTNGNNFNNPVGAVAVPSAVNVLYNQLPAGGSTDGCATLARELDAVGDPVSACVLDDGRLELRIRAITCDVVSAVGREIARHEGAAQVGLVLDLRDNRGGELDAALRLAGEFLPLDVGLLIREQPTGERVTLRNRVAGRWQDLPLTVRVDRATASAAETLAGILARHHCADVTGGPTFGKTTVTDANGHVVATVHLPDGDDTTR